MMSCRRFLMAGVLGLTNCLNLVINEIASVIASHLAVAQRSLSALRALTCLRHRLSVASYNDIQ